MILSSSLAAVSVLLGHVLAAPEQEVLSESKKISSNKFFDVQAHRGGRGNTIENTLPSFAWGLIDGATTLELDNGLTKDGALVVWHDEEILPTKCQDTGPAFPGDTDFPYVGKFLANLTLAQVKTLDCGSKRQSAYPLQITYPGTRISTLRELFDFAECADPTHQIRWNIESKVNPHFSNRTRSPLDFAVKQYEVFSQSPYLKSITYQSFDWRSLVIMKRIDPSVITSALIDMETAMMPDNSTSPWLAGLRLDSFEGPSLGEQVAQAAHAIGADVLSPDAGAGQSDTINNFVSFTTKEMVDEAHGFNMTVKPWTVNGLNVVEQLARWKVNGIITDYPILVRRWAKHNNFPVAPKYPKQRVLTCLEKHLQTSN